MNKPVKSRLRQDQVRYPDFSHTRQPKILSKPLNILSVHENIYRSAVANMSFLRN